METLPTELIYELLLIMPYEEVINLCQTNQFYLSICKSNGFWIDKAIRDFNVTRKEATRYENVTPYWRYIQLLAKFRGVCIPGSEKVVDSDTCLYNASKQNNLLLVKYFVEKGANIILASGVFTNAALNNNEEMINYLLSKIHNSKDITYLLEEALKGAAIAGNIDLYRKIVLRGMRETSYFPNYEILSSILYSLAKTTNIQMYNYILKLLLMDNLDKKFGLLNGSLNYVVDPVMLNNILNNGAVQLGNTIMNAATNNYLDIIKYIIDNLSEIKKNYPNVMVTKEDLNEALLRATVKGNIGIVIYLVSKDRVLHMTYNIDLALKTAQEYINLYKFRPEMVMKLNEAINYLQSL